MDQKRINLLLGIASIFFAVLAIILLVFGIVYDKSVLAKVLLFVAAFLVLALAAEIAYLFVLSRDTKPNYFLFNPAVNRNIGVDKLTFQMIDARMNKYLSSFAASEGKLWTDRILEKTGAELESHFKPVVAYKLLLDIAEHDAEAGWKCFVLASDETIEFIAQGVQQNGDGELANTLRQLKSAKPLNMKLVRDYLVGNKKYIRKKLFKYVVDNIDMF